MRKITNLLFVLVFLPLFLSPDARADTFVVTSGALTVIGVQSQIHGRFTFINKARGFEAQGAFSEGAFKRPGAGPYADPPGTVDLSFASGYHRGGSITINGVTHRGVNVIYGTNNSNFPFIVQPLVLPPPDPPTPQTPSEWRFVVITVPFKLDAVMDTHPCGVWQECDRILTNRLTGRGIARIRFAIHFVSGSYNYHLTGATYEFLPSDNLSTLSTGNGEQKFAFSISEHGNLRNLQSPKHFNHVSTREGYVLCSNGGLAAFDDGETDSGWSAPVILQPGGANTLPLTITRRTLDGRLEFKQNFEWDARQREVFITMTVKNISGAVLTGVKLSRYFDGDIDTAVDRYFDHLFDHLVVPLASDDRYAAVSDSVWGWDDGPGTRHHGLMLTALPSGFNHSSSVEKYSDWASTGTGARTARTCSPVNQASPTAPGDYVGRMTYNFGSIAAGVSKTVKVQYKRM